MNLKKVLTCATVGAMTAAMSVAAFAETQVIALDVPGCYDAPATVTSASLGYTGSAVMLKVQGFGKEGEQAAYWNDWCSLTVKITDDNGVAYIPVVGAEVSWDITVAGGDTDDESDDIKVPVSEAIKFDKYDAEAGAIDCQVKCPVSGNFTIEVLSNGWNDSAESSACAYYKIVEAAVLDAAAAEAAGDVAPVAYLAAVVALAGLALVATKKSRA